MVDQEPLSVTANGVNLRRGPGADCDVISAMAAGTAATALSGPVNAGDRLWLLVEIDGTEGWIAADFVE